MAQASFPIIPAVAADASSQGILHCLRMLAEEAASLNLERTLLAIHDAMDACEAEVTDPLLGFEALPPDARLH